MMKSEKPQSGRFSFFLIVSILTHVVFFALLYLGPRYLFFTEIQRRTNHTIENKTEDLITQIELINEEDSRKQVVEQSDTSINEEIPDEADFLSGKNQKVKEQTKAANNGAFKNTSAPGVTQIGSKGQESESNEKSKSKNNKNDNKLEIKNFGLNGFPIGEKLNENSYAENRKSSPTLLGEGPSQTDDYLKDVEAGDQTLLNTKEFIYYSYFMRVKDQLRSHWNPRIRQNIQVLYAKDRSIANSTLKSTSIRVTLNKSGYLEKIELLKTSGYEELDIAAIQAFRSAAPFLNPPPGLLEKDKRIRIVWDFILES